MKDDQKRKTQRDETQSPLLRGVHLMFSTHFKVQQTQILIKYIATYRDTITALFNVQCLSLETKIEKKNTKQQNTEQHQNE